jgi:hypothetical protein
MKKIKWVNVVKVFVLIACIWLIATDFYKVIVLGASWTYLGGAVFIGAISLATNIVEQLIIEGSR